MKPKKDYVLSQIQGLREAAKINGAHIQVLIAAQKLHQRRQADLKLKSNRCQSTIDKIRSLNRQEKTRNLWG